METQDAGKERCEVSRRKEGMAMRVCMSLTWPRDSRSQCCAFFRKWIHQKSGEVTDHGKNTLFEGLYSSTTIDVALSYKYTEFNASLVPKDRKQCQGCPTEEPPASAV